jgi:hypothetical protein
MKASSPRVWDGHIMIIIPSGGEASLHALISTPDRSLELRLQWVLGEVVANRIRSWSLKLMSLCSMDNDGLYRPGRLRLPTQDNSQIWTKQLRRSGYRCVPGWLRVFRRVFETDPQQTPSERARVTVPSGVGTGGKEQCQIQAGRDQLRR